MGQVLHGSARTTEAVPRDQVRGRLAIQHSHRRGDAIVAQACDEARPELVEGVEVIQCPCGALPKSGLPRRSQPRSCVMLVVVPVSSTNTRRLKSTLRRHSNDASHHRNLGRLHPACAARQTSRATATSGRSCSVA